MRHPDRENWLELQRAMMRWSALVTALVAWATWHSEVHHRGDLRLMALAMAMMLVAFLLGAWGSGSRVAGAALVAACFGAMHWGYGVLGYREFAPFFVVPVVLAPFLVAPWAGAVAAGIGALLLVAGGTDGEPGLPITVASVITVGGCCSLLVAQLSGALERAWVNAATSVNLVREVRVRQEEVSRLNSALRVANELLKRSLRELYLAQKEAEEARHLKEQFGTTVSHELRTPLSVILGFLDVMQRYPHVYGLVNWTPALRRDVSEMQRSARYLSDLVDDILDLARIQALKMPIHREEADINGIVREVAELASRLLRVKDSVSLELDLAGDLPHIHVDRLRIRQVLLNLLTNACRFTDRGKIRVETAQVGDEVIISVSDSGRGVPEGQLGVIFEEFRQSSSPHVLQQTIAGKGLGLAIAKRFVHLHGGRIWAESEVGVGSSFHFSLPVTQKQVVDLLPARATPHPGAEDSRAVILVDDGPGQAYLRRHLDGREVLLAPDLMAARRLVREHHPDAVIVNVSPGPEGPFAPTLPPVLPEPVPVLQCSLPALRSRDSAGLFSDWLVKPIDSGALLAVLSRYPGSRRVFIVDDDHSFVRLLRRVLEAQDGRYELAWAYDAEEALAKLSGWAADLVLLDIALPGMSGRGLARALRDRDSSGAPIIIGVTAVRPGEDAASAPASFCVTSYSGISEEATLGLIESCLAHLRPSYGGALLAEASQANLPE